MYRNNYHRTTSERKMKALSEQSPMSLEEFRKQCDEGKSPAVMPGEDQKEGGTMYRSDYHRTTTLRKMKALSEQQPGSLEEFRKQCEEGEISGSDA